ncbi:RWP-RK domain-containing protein, partial [Baffinella frigidus]
MPEGQGAGQGNRELKLEELSKYFHLPEKAVAKELGICLTSLKKLCRSYGITRWPFRKLKSLERTMRKVQDETEQTVNG